MARFGNRGGGAAAAPAKKGRFAGVKAADNRYPIAVIGDYTLRVLETYVSYNAGKKTEWYHADFEVVETANEDHKVGSKVSMLQQISGAAEDVGLPKVKRFVMACVQCADEAEFESNDGEDLSNTTCGDVSEKGFEPNPLAGRLVYAQVSRGKDKGPSDYFRDWAFNIVEEQPPFGGE